MKVVITHFLEGSMGLVISNNHNFLKRLDISFSLKYKFKHLHHCFFVDIIFVAVIK
jgi:hypothetical protein